jgi:hypothetical protein
MLSRFDRALLCGLAAYTVGLVAIPLLLPAPVAKLVTSESGPFEVGALVLWLAAAVTLAIRIRPFTARTLAFAGLYVIFAAREADLHKAFTAESISRLSYYRHSAAPLAEKLAAGAFALLFLLLVAHAIWVCARFLLRGGLRSRSGFWLAFAGVLLVATKAVDRTQAVLDRFGTALPLDVARFVPALEEGLEAAVPLLFAVSAWISQAERRYLS